MIPDTSARFIHDPLKPWRRPSGESLEGRTVLWHTLWSDTYSNPRYAELLPRLEQLFFAPIRLRSSFLGRIGGAVTRRFPLIERQTLHWYQRAGIRVLLTPRTDQLSLFPAPAVLDLDDPTFAPDEEAALQATGLRHVIATTAETADYVRLANEAVDVSVIPQGVDLDRAARARHEAVRRELLSAMGLSYDTVVVGYHAPIVCLSGDEAYADTSYRTFDVDVLISSVRRLWSEGVSFVTVLVGEPSPSIAQLAREEHRFVLAGYVDRDRLFDWVGAFDIGTYPRTVDFRSRQSVKVLEYMANDAAVVAMRTGETRLLDERRAGYTAADIDEFSASLKRLIENREERRILINRARALVAEHDWKTLGARYDRILAAVVAAE